MFFRQFKMASGNAVIITSVLAGVFIFVALVTPGWFGLHMKSSDSDVKVCSSLDGRTRS